MRAQIQRPIIAALALVITSAAFCQELLITPKWKRDDLRTMYITRTQTVPTVNEDGEAGELVIPYKTSSKVKVYEVTPEVVMISIDHENMVLPLLRPYFETGFPSEIEPFRRMIIRYEVDRATGSPRLMNASDLREFVKRAADHCMRALRKKDATMAEQIEASLQPMLQQFENEASIESSIYQQFGFLFEAFGRSLAQGAPMEIEETMYAPFAGADSAQITTTHTLMSRSDDQAELKIEKELSDRAMPAKAKPGAPKATPANNAIGMSAWRQQQLLTIDLRTTWPIRMSASTRVELSDGSSASEETTVEIR